MSRTRIAFLLVFAPVLAATGRGGESATPPQTGAAEASSAAVTPGLLAVPRALSADTAAKLTASVPVFVAPPAHGEPRITATPAAPVESANEVKPRNTIIRLPEYIVRDPKVPAIKEREVLTPKARLELARKQHPGFQLGNLFGLNNGIALAMLAEQERLNRKREFEDLASLTRFGDPAGAAKVKRQVEQAFMRERDFGR